MPRPALLALVLMTAAAGLAAIGCADEPKPLPAAELRIATGTRGGVYEPYGAAIAAVINDHVPPLSASTRRTAGSVQSLRLLRDGGAQMALTRADAADAELPPGQTNIVALARLYDSYVQVLTLAPSPFEDVEDLARCGDRPCRVWVGQPGSGTRLVAGRVLDAARLSGRVTAIGEGGIGDAVRALEERRIDALMWTGGLPTPAIKRLRDRGVDIDFVDLGQVAADLEKDHPNVYRRDELPSRAYGTQPGVGTVRMANYLTVRSDMDEAVAHALTAALFAHRRELVRGHQEAKYLNTRSAPDIHPLELHAGAARYYREVAG